MGRCKVKLQKNIIYSEAKLLELEQIITKNDRNMVLFIEHVRNLSKLYSVANSKTLDMDNARKILNELWKTYYKLLDQYDLSDTLKMHIICDHYEDYFELTRETLYLVTDDVTKSIHSGYISLEERKGYICPRKGSMSHVKKQQNMSYTTIF